MIYPIPIVRAMHFSLSHDYQTVWSWIQHIFQLVGILVFSSGINGMCQFESVRRIPCVHCDEAVELLDFVTLRGRMIATLLDDL